jgi:hypothetical protein
MHLMGCLLYNKVVKPYVFFTLQGIGINVTRSPQCILSRCESKGWARVYKCVVPRSHAAHPFMYKKHLFIYFSCSYLSLQLLSFCFLLRPLDPPHSSSSHTTRRRHIGPDYFGSLPRLGIHGLPL